MRKIEFREVEKSRAGNLYLVANFEGGDADTDHPQEYRLPFGFAQWEENLSLIEKEAKDFEILKSLLDGGEKVSYKSIIEEHGEEIARMYDNAPNDPQTDYDTKCYLDSVDLIGYDAEGNKHKAYLL
jgi:hypothetical protein